MNIGVLALQGAFIEHINMLKDLGVNALEVRNKNDLKNIDGLIIPGGESTVIRKLLIDLELRKIIKDKIIKEKMPVFGTCAGMIVLSKFIGEETNDNLGLIDIKVKRNGYGRQLGSFSIKKKVEILGDEKFNHIFIRAPYIKSVGKDVSIISVIDQKIVAAEKDNILVTAFHPELTNDYRFHGYFLEKVKEYKK